MSSFQRTIPLLFQFGIKTLIHRKTDFMFFYLSQSSPVRFVRPVSILHPSLQIDLILFRNVLRLFQKPDQPFFKRKLRPPLRIPRFHFARKTAVNGEALRIPLFRSGTVRRVRQIPTPRKTLLLLDPVLDLMDQRGTDLIRRKIFRYRDLFPRTVEIAGRSFHLTRRKKRQRMIPQLRIKRKKLRRVDRIPHRQDLVKFPVQDLRTEAPVVGILRPPFPVFSPFPARHKLDIPRIVLPAALHLTRG